VSNGENVLANAPTGGDEPVELSQKLLGRAVVLADSNRIAAANWARETFGITAFVLDDAFQHRRARRDLDVVCIDATNPFGNGEILPAGTLREPLRNLRRADVIVITRSNLVESSDSLRAKILKYAPDAKIVCCSIRISGFANLRDFRSKDGIAQDQTVAGLKSVAEDASFFAFCGIGNPENFFEQSRFEGLRVVGTRAFRDHHPYSRADVRAIESRAKKAGADRLLTTAKDAVKLTGVEFAMDCYVALTELVIDDDMVFRDLILSF
jgi:tetraacyldisaccharide 4'-kinase